MRRPDAGRSRAAGHRPPADRLLGPHAAGPRCSRSSPTRSRPRASPTSCSCRSCPSAARASCSRPPASRPASSTTGCSRFPPELDEHRAQIGRVEQLSDAYHLRVGERDLSSPTCWRSGARPAGERRRSRERVMAADYALRLRASSARATRSTRSRSSARSARSSTAAPPRPRPRPTSTALLLTQRRGGHARRRARCTRARPPQRRRGPARRARDTPLLLAYPLLECELLRRRQARLVRRHRPLPARALRVLATLGWREYVAAPIVVDGAAVGLSARRSRAERRPLAQLDADALEHFAAGFAPNIWCRNRRCGRPRCRAR